MTIGMTLIIRWKVFEIRWKLIKLDENLSDYMKLIELDEKMNKLDEQMRISLIQTFKK